LPGEEGGMNEERKRRRQKGGRRGGKVTKTLTKREKGGTEE
jgi:hypothetical protein